MSHLTTIIPVFNGERFLPATLESLARQTRRPDRLIILDDGSTDATPEIVRHFAPIKCDYLRNDRNLGVFPNHNRALEFSAQTDCLHILHANDLIKPEFNQRVMAALDSTPGPALAFSRYECIDTEDHLLTTVKSESGPPRPISRKRFLAWQSELKAVLVDATILKTCRRPAPCLFRLDFPHVADCVFHAEFVAQGQQIFEIPQALCQFRRHAGVTRLNMNSLQSWVLDEWRAMCLIAGLIQEPVWRRRLRAHKLRSLFAARSFVKVRMTQSVAPDFARQIRHSTIQTVGRWHWALGKSVVLARDGACDLLSKPRPYPTYQ